MTLYLYKIGKTVPTLTIEDAVSYTDSEVQTADGTVYNPLAEDYELSALPDCSQTLRADWRTVQQLQDIPLVLCSGVDAAEEQANSFRQGVDGLVVVSVAVTPPNTTPIHVADLPEGYRPGAVISSGDIAIKPDGSVWASGSMAGTLCFYAP